MRFLIPLALAMAAMAADTYQASDDRPMLGVEMSPVPINVQNQQGLGSDEGVLVRNVFPGTAASNMGVQPGDVITTINGAPITSMTDLRNTVSSYEVGDQVALTVRRNGEDLPLQSTFDAWPTHIPFDRIDADAERRFKDWQQRRQARHRDAISRLDAQVADMKKDLEKPSAAPFTQSPALMQAKSLLGLIPAWKVDYRYDTRDIAPAAGRLPVTTSTATSQTPWQATVITSTRYRML